MLSERSPICTITSPGRPRAARAAPPDTPTARPAASVAREIRCRRATLSAPSRARLQREQRGKSWPAGERTSAYPRGGRARAAFTARTAANCVPRAVLSPGRRARCALQRGRRRRPAALSSRCDAEAELGSRSTLPLTGAAAGTARRWHAVVATHAAADRRWVVEAAPHVGQDATSLARTLDGSEGE